MFQQIINFICMRNYRLKRLAKKLLQNLESEITEEFLELLLRGMSLFLCVNTQFRENIKNFSGRYQFKNSDGTITVAARFGKNKLKVSEGTIKDTDIVINFKNANTVSISYRGIHIFQGITRKFQFSNSTGQFCKIIQRAIHNLAALIKNIFPDISIGIFKFNKACNFLSIAYRRNCNSAGKLAIYVVYQYPSTLKRLRIAFLGIPLILDISELRQQRGKDRRYYSQRYKNLKQG